MASSCRTQCSHRQLHGWAACANVRSGRNTHHEELGATCQQGSLLANCWAGSATGLLAVSWSGEDPITGLPLSAGAVLRLAASSGVHRRLKIGAPDVTDKVDQDLLAASILAPSSRRLRAPGAFPVSRAEVVVAMHADSSQVPIVEASRAWRKVRGPLSTVCIAG